MFHGRESRRSRLLSRDESQGGDHQSHYLSCYQDRSDRRQGCFLPSHQADRHQDAGEEAIAKGDHSGQQVTPNLIS